MHREPEPLPVDEMTWAALLGRWLDFARASVALPKDAEGQRWRLAVAPIITLQAVSFALRQLDDLPEDERALGLDRAEILVRQESRNLNEAWRGEPMPELLLELMSDARLALRSATIGAAVELVVIGSDGGGSFTAEACRVVPAYGAALDVIDAAKFGGEIHLAQPGTLLAPGEVMGFVVGGSARAWRRQRLNAAEAFQGELPALAEALMPFRVRYVDRPRQVYRQTDAQGRITGDVAAPLVGDPLAGQPLLARVWCDGTVSASDIGADERNAQQRRAWPKGGMRFDDGAERVGQVAT